MAGYNSIGLLTDRTVGMTITANKLSGSTISFTITLPSAGLKDPVRAFEPLRQEMLLQLQLDRDEGDEDESAQGSNDSTPQKTRPEELICIDIRDRTNCGVHRRISVQDSNEERKV